MLARPWTVGTFDIAALMMNAYRVFGPVDTEQTMRGVAWDLPTLARSQLEVAEAAYGDGRTP
jgi:hypothetical protein